MRELNGGWAFYSCGKLTEINLPAALKTIGGVAFGNCSELYTLTIPDTITTLKWPKDRDVYPNDAFGGDGKLPLATRQKLKDLGYKDEF